MEPERLLGDALRPTLASIDVDRCTPSAALKVLDPSRLLSRAPLVSGDFPQMFLVCLKACQSSSDLKRCGRVDQEHGKGFCGR
ncbi:unnamed protein product [Boreogadus saida]